MLLWTACAVACSDSDPAPQPDDEGPTPPPDKEQQVVCGIEKPEEGASVNLAEKLTIAGTGVATVGEIEKVVLKVGGIVVPEVTDVPFEIEYTFPAEQAEGELKLELSVEGDAGATASTEVTVTTYRKEGPAAPVEGTMTDARDGNVYKTVKLADQVWMAENLRYLPEQHDDVSDTEPRYYIWSDYDKDTQLGAEALKVYGAFYNWKAALQGEEPQTSADQAPVRGVCPEGWHVSTMQEWKAVRTAADYSAARVKSAQYWTGSTGTNDTGLNIVPAGKFWPGNVPSPDNADDKASFWTTTKTDATTAQMFEVFGWSNEIVPWNFNSRPWSEGDGTASMLVNVRCVRDRD